jgi:hypothetical protein
LSLFCSFFLFFLFFFFFSSLLHAQVPVTNGLKGYWGLNGNVLDSSGNANNGTLQGGAIYCADRFGVANKAVKLGGFYNSSAVFIPNSPSLHLNKELTIACWFKLDNTGGMDGWGNYSQYGNLHAFICKDGDRTGFFMGYHFNADYTQSVRYSIYNNTSCSNQWDFTYFDGQNCINTEWNHVALVVDSISITMYINGMQKHRQTYSSQITFPQANLRDLTFGRFGYNCGLQGWYPLNGKLDDICYYNRALSQAEIIELYNYPTAYVPPITMITTNLTDNCNLGDIYEANGFSLGAQTTLGTFTYSRTNGCDSMWVLNLTVSPLPCPPSIIQNDTICTGMIHNGILYNDAGVYNNMDTLVAVTGCDSIVLNLVVKQCVDPFEYQPLSLQYTACPNAQITMGFQSVTGIQYYWYNAQTGGTIVANGANTNTLTVTKGSAQDIGTWWVEARNGVIAYPRHEIVLLEGTCGTTNPTNCAATGTVLFREDFDGYGNGLNPTTSQYSTGALPAGITTYNFSSTSSIPDGSYALAKKSENSGDWYIYDDYTHPNNPSVGRFMLVNADYTPKVFYKQELQNLCEASQLYFSTMIANCHSYNSSNPFIKPDLTFILYNSQTNAVVAIFSTGNIPDCSVYTDWRQWGFTFTVPANINSILLEIKNNAPGGWGNDLGLDNIEIRLCAPPVIVNSPDSICKGVSLSIPAIFNNNATFAEPLEYQWFYSITGDMLDQTSWTAINGQTTNTLNINSFQIQNEGYYRLAIAGNGAMSQENCRAMSNPFFIKMMLCQVFDTIFVTTCADAPYNFNGILYSVTGSYTDTLQTTAGTDSIVTLNLTVNPINQKTIDATICANETCDFYGKILNTSGTYRDTVSGTACDTIVTLNLTVLDLHTEFAREICQGDSLFFAGKYLYNTGVYCDTLPGTLGCDSLITLTLTVYQPAQTIFNETGCIGQRYYKYGFNFTPDSAGTYHFEQHRQTANGCDSLVSLTLQVPEIAVEISSSNPDFCSTHETVLTAITPNNNIRWNTGEMTPEITVMRHGTYTVTVSEQDCELLAQFTIEICPIVIAFPNAITPGKIDGVNKYFYLPAADDVLELTITIYNRWGNTVFASTDPHFRWDGKVKGEVVQGVYSYVCLLRTIDRKQQYVTGVITVL